MQTPSTFNLPNPLDADHFPPPSPPKFLKHQVYENPDVFSKVDQHAIQVSQRAHHTFRDLMWDLVFRVRLQELEKARVIFRWMTSKNMYEICFQNELPGTPEEVLTSFRKRKGTLARILEVMCCYAQIPCISISGFAKGVEYLPGQKFQGRPANHSWNAIFIQGAWQLIDAHWATRYLSSDKNIPENLVYEYDDFYFIMEPQQAVYSHFPNITEWQLLDRPLTLQQFEDLPLTKSQFFKCGMDFRQQHHGVVHTCEGKLKMCLGFWKPGTFTYSLQYGEAMEENYAGTPLKNFALQETLDSQLNFFFRLPMPGVFYLTVYASDSSHTYRSTQRGPGRTNVAESVFRAACEYKIICDQAAQDASPYPACHDVNWGPSWPLVIHYGLEPSVRDGVIPTHTGSVEVRFGRQRPEVNLLAKLRRNGIDDEVLDSFMQEYVAQDTEEVVFTANLPEGGEYGMEIYANDPRYEGDTYTHICQYMLYFQPPPGFRSKLKNQPVSTKLYQANPRQMWNYEDHAPSIGTLPRPYLEAEADAMVQKMTEGVSRLPPGRGHPQETSAYLYHPGQAAQMEPNGRAKQTAGWGGPQEDLPPPPADFYGEGAEGYGAQEAAGYRGMPAGNVRVEVGGTISGSTAGTGPGGRMRPPGYGGQEVTEDIMTRGSQGPLHAQAGGPGFGASGAVGAQVMPPSGGGGGVEAMEPAVVAAAGTPSMQAQVGRSGSPGVAAHGAVRGLPGSAQEPAVAVLVGKGEAQAPGITAYGGRRGSPGMAVQGPGVTVHGARSGSPGARSGSPGAGVTVYGGRTGSPDIAVQGPGVTVHGARSGSPGMAAQGPGVTVHGARSGSPGMAAQGPGVTVHGARSGSPGMATQGPGVTVHGAKPGSPSLDTASPSVTVHGSKAAPPAGSQQQPVNVKVSGLRRSGSASSTGSSGSSSSGSSSSSSSGDSHASGGEGRATERADGGTRAGKDQTRRPQMSNSPRGGQDRGYGGHSSPRGPDADQYNKMSSQYIEPVWAYKPEESTANWSKQTIERMPMEFVPQPVQASSAPKPALETLPPSVDLTLASDDSRDDRQTLQKFEHVDSHAMAVSRTSQSNFNQLIWELIFARRITDDLEKIRAIFLWLCTKDLSKMNFSGVQDNSPESILMGINTGRSTYAQVFQTLCNYAGLHCNIIPGYAKGAEYAPGMRFSGRQGQHSWNAVFVNGVWSLIDCHWAARRLIGKQSSIENIRYELDMFYFLPNPAHLIYTHFPLDKEWQLLREPISLQEFESLAPVKSAFFKFGLRLRTHRFAVVSCGEELSLKIGHPSGAADQLSFTFTLAFADAVGSSAGETEEWQGVKLSNYGMQEMAADNSSTFTVRPPRPGAYKFLIYAKRAEPQQSDSVFGAVCEYRLEADFHSGSALPPFPPCQNQSYGPCEAARRYGLESSSPSAVIQMGNAGCAEVRFRPSHRGVRMMAKLRSRLHAEEQLTRCLLLRHITDSEIIVSVFPPDAGEYGLELYACDSKSDGGSYYMVWQHLVVAFAPSPVRGLPSIPASFLGPLPKFTQFGLETVSHSDPFLQSNTGDLCVQVRSPSGPMRMMAQLIEATFDANDDCSQYVLQQSRNEVVFYLIRFPKPGYYKFVLFALPFSDPADSIPAVFNYLAEASRPSKSMSPFPQQFQQWKEGCYLHSPHDGRIPATGPYVTFEMEVPNATAVAVVIGDDWTQLEKTGDRWKGDVYIEKHVGGGGALQDHTKRVSVCANYGSFKSSYSTILEYTL